MIGRKLSLLLLAVAFVAVPVWAGTHSAAAFKKLQSLSGDWEGKDEHGMPVKTTFKVLASGTAVMETLSPPGMEEMVTLYSMDGDGIALVHYCPTNNQPRMRVVPASDDVKELSFDFEGAGNLKSPGTGHQHHLVLRFDDPDHLTETWTWRQDNKDVPMLFRLIRKKNQDNLSLQRRRMGQKTVDADYWACREISKSLGLFWRHTQR
jgi:hypothetical protein